MAKKPQTSDEKNIEETNRAEALYDRMIDSLNGLRPAVYPVIFENERYKHLNGNEAEKTGQFVQMMDLHQKDEFSKLAQKFERWTHPQCLLYLVTRAACTYAGTQMFNPENASHLSLLVKESEFTREIFEEAMFVNCYWDRPLSDIAKNSQGTPKPASESDSVSNSESPTESSLNPTSSPQKNGNSIGQQTKQNPVTDPKDS